MSEYFNKGLGRKLRNVLVLLSTTSAITFGFASSAQAQGAEEKSDEPIIVTGTRIKA